MMPDQGAEENPQGIEPKIHSREPYVAVQVHRHPPASEPVWHRRFMLVEDKLAEVGHWAGRDDHHAKVCPICTVLRRARGCGEVTVDDQQPDQAGNNGG